MSHSISPHLFIHIVGFDWDNGNINKNMTKHNVTWQESEECFRNRPLIIVDDPLHSQHESRFVLHGKTNQERPLTLIFTTRNNQFRVISARDQSKKERKIYDQQKT